MNKRAVRRTRFTCGVAAVVVGSSILLPDAAVAAPPGNDAFDAAAAYPIPSGAVSGTTAEATLEPGEPATSSTGTVWYRVTARRSIYAGICVVSAVGAVAEPFSGPSVQVLGPPGVEITPAINAPLYKELSTVKCPGGSAQVRFYSLNGAGDRFVRVSSATPGAFTLYVIDGYAPIECADSKKQIKKYERWIVKTKKQLRKAIRDHAPTNVVNPLKRYLKKLKQRRKEEIEFRDEVCSYV